LGREAIMMASAVSAAGGLLGDLSRRHFSFTI
jgi:hypothetical protein